MHIDDIIVGADAKVREAYQRLNDHLTRTMREQAGSDLSSHMTEVFGSEEKAKEWFYTRSISLGEKRPYNYCVDGAPEVIEREIMNIEYGNLA